MVTAALFDRLVAVGDVRPDGETRYLGYERVPVGPSFDKVQFPVAIVDYVDGNGEFILVRCVALLDDTETVIAARELLCNSRAIALATTVASIKSGF